MSDWRFLANVIVLVAAALVFVVGPVVHVIRTAARGRRYRWLLAELARPAEPGTTTVVWWSRHRHVLREKIVEDAEHRGWSYRGQRVSTVGWALVFERVLDGAAAAAHHARVHDPAAMRAALLDELRSARAAADREGRVELDPRPYLAALDWYEVKAMCADDKWLVEEEHRYTAEPLLVLLDLALAPDQARHEEGC